MKLALLEEMLQQRENLGPRPGWRQALAQRVRGEIKFDEPLKRYTTIQIGGPADVLLCPSDLEDLQAAIKFAGEWQVPWTVLGWGSNTLIRDGGIRGIVLRLHKSFSRFEILEDREDEAVVEVQAGVPLPKLVEQGRQQGWRGVEAWFGIPASIGGAIFMNAGTRHGEIQSALSSVECVLTDGSLQNYTAKRLKFSYRNTRFPGRVVVVSGRFHFKKVDPAQVESKLREYQKKRTASQPLEFPNFGSVFKNPEKGFAAQMIDELGLKGVRVGGARISDKHANFIINERQATAHDVLALIGLVRDKVKEHFDINLEPEVKIIGEDGDASSSK